MFAGEDEPLVDTHVKVECGVLEGVLWVFGCSFLCWILMEVVEMGNLNSNGKVWTI